MRTHGIGVGYRNPHDYEGDDVDQQYLPDLLVGKRYYVPTDRGWKHRWVRASLRGRRREGPGGRAASRVRDPVAPD